MSYSTWLNYLKSAEKSSVIQHDVRKLLYKFPDKHDMIEEYSMSTGMILKRAWKKKRDLLTFSPKDSLVSDGRFEWEYELGDFTKPINSNDDFLVQESSTTPMLTKRITKTKIEWRIRNLPYPLDVYNVTVDPVKTAVVVRTTNKKYFKSINVPELERCQTSLDPTKLAIDHKFNTLIITYDKPAVVMEMEADVLRLLQDVETEVDEEDDLEIVRKMLKRE